MDDPVVIEIAVLFKDGNATLIDRHGRRITTIDADLVSAIPSESTISAFQWNEWATENVNRFKLNRLHVKTGWAAKIDAMRSGFNIRAIDAMNPLRGTLRHRWARQYAEAPADWDDAAARMIRRASNKSAKRCPWGKWADGITRNARRRYERKQRRLDHAASDSRPA